MKKLDVEILAEGKWNGIPFNRSMMEQVVTNFSTFKDLVQVYLKLGHNKEQPMTDGQPAIGWVEALHINEAGKLVATFVNLPTIVYNALEKKLYRNVSIEALLDVEHKGKKYGTVLTAVALLGADMPAVNTLSDLQTYMSTGEGLEFSTRLEFSAINGTLYNDEDNNMTELEKAQAEVARLKALADANAEAVKLSATQTAEKDAEIARLKAETEANKKAAEALEFSRRTDTVKADLEALVVAKTITPAKRDEMVNSFSAETADKVEFAISMFKDLTSADKGTDPTAKKGDAGDNSGAPDEVLHTKAVAFSAANKVTYAAAVEAVMESDPKLAREYLNQLEDA